MTLLTRVETIEFKNKLDQILLEKLIRKTERQVIANEGTSRLVNSFTLLKEFKKDKTSKILFNIGTFNSLPCVEVMQICSYTYKISLLFINYSSKLHCHIMYDSESYSISDAMYYSNQALTDFFEEMPNKVRYLNIVNNLITEVRYLKGFDI